MGFSVQLDFIRSFLLRINKLAKRRRRPGSQAGGCVGRIKNINIPSLSSLKGGGSWREKAATNEDQEHEPKSKRLKGTQKKKFKSTTTQGVDEVFMSHDGIPSLESAYARFTEAYPDFLETLVVDDLRVDEYGELQEEGHVCLDYSGYGLFSQLQQDLDITSSSFALSYISANLPSHALYGGADEGTVEFDIRRRIMRFLNIQEDEYSMVFTASRGSAFKLLAESYPFDINKRLLTMCDYESEAVSWMEEIAQRKSANIMSASFKWPSLTVCATDLKRQLLEKKRKTETSKGLFVFPVQSRVTGTKYSYQWMSLAQENDWHVLLDASALGPKDMDSLGLSLFRPDFIVTSFYKVFGSDPTGFGCLFIKNSSIQCLQNSSAARGVGMVRLTPLSGSSSSNSFSEVPAEQGHEMHEIEEVEGEIVSEKLRRKRKMGHGEPAFSGPLASFYKRKESHFSDTETKSDTGYSLQSHGVQSYEVVGNGVCEHENENDNEGEIESIRKHPVIGATAKLGNMHKASHSKIEEPSQSDDLSIPCHGGNQDEDCEDLEGRAVHIRDITENDSIEDTVQRTSELDDCEEASSSTGWKHAIQESHEAYQADGSTETVRGELETGRKPITPTSVLEESLAEGPGQNEYCVREKIFKPVDKVGSERKDFKPMDKVSSKRKDKNGLDHSELGELYCSEREISDTESVRSGQRIHSFQKASANTIMLLSHRQSNNFAAQRKSSLGYHSHEICLDVGSFGGAEASSQPWSSREHRRECSLVHSEGSSYYAGSEEDLEFSSSLYHEDEESSEFGIADDASIIRREPEIFCRGLNHADTLGLNKTNDRFRYLINWLISSLLKLHHLGSKKFIPLVQIYGPKVKYDRGASLAFNLFDQDGILVKPILVQQLADRSNISLGTSFLYHVQFPENCSDLQGLLEPQRNSNIGTLTAEGQVEELGKSSRLGVVTVALGFVTNFEDVYRLWAFVAKFLDADFVSKEICCYRYLNQEQVVVGMQQLTR